MKKTFMAAFTVFMLLVGASSTFAHTHLTGTDPLEGAIVTTELTEINLTFDGPIEQGGTIDLTAPTGETISVEQITVADGIMTGTLAKPLPNGDYTATWLSISADGHPVEGEFTFKVNVPVVEETETVEEATAEQNADPAEVETAEESSNTMLFLIIALVVIILISALFVFKRKK